MSCLKAIVFQETLPAHGKVRIRWTCACGTRLYDDFMEIRSGAAKRLEAALNGTNQQRPCGQQSTQTNVTNNFQPRISLAGSSSSTPAGFSNLGLSRLTSSYDPRPMNGRPTLTNVTSSPEMKWLLVCAQAWHRPTSLLHLNLCMTTSDQELFTGLRQLYLALKKTWWQKLSLKAVTSIKFVQFELHPKDLVDIRKVPAMPPQSKMTEYHCEEYDLIPPIGENLMTHLFHNPHDGNEKAITFRRSPKKLGQKLAVCPQRGTSLGWGVQIVEDWATNKIWLLALLLFVLSSIIFAITWSVLEHDLQGAFGAAAYFVALMGLCIGTMQAHINQR